MTVYAPGGMEVRAFDGRQPEPLRTNRSRRHVTGGHGRECSSNPEIGCNCPEPEPVLCLDCGNHYDPRDYICGCHEPVTS